MAEKNSRKTSARVKGPPIEAPRHNAPRGIAALLAPVLRPVLTRRGTALAALIADWGQIAGPEVASRSLPVKFAAGTLTIGCSGPDALSFQHAAPTLIARINLALGGAPVQRLRFTDLNIAPAVHLSYPPVSASAVPRPSSLPDGPLGEALTRLHSGLTRRGHAGGS